MGPINQFIQELHLFETNTNLIIHRLNFDVTNIQGYMSRKQTGILFIFGPLLNKMYEYGMSPQWLWSILYLVLLLLIPLIFSIIYKFKLNYFLMVWKFFCFTFWGLIVVIIFASIDQYYMYHTSLPFLK